MEWQETSFPRVGTHGFERKVRLHMGRDEKERESPTVGSWKGREKVRKRGQKRGLERKRDLEGRGKVEAREWPWRKGATDRQEARVQNFPISGHPG